MVRECLLSYPLSYPLHYLLPPTKMIFLLAVFMIMVYFLLCFIVPFAVGPIKVLNEYGSNIMSEQIRNLAGCIRERNKIDAEIARIIGIPTEKGHIGEFIASQIFGITLHTSATHKGSDGEFTDRPLKGKTVNVKYYGKQEGILDINTQAIPDFY